VLVREGKLAEARQAYEDALAIAKQLAAADKGNADRQRGLSVSYGNLGNVLVSEGKLAEARQAYGDALAIAKQLTEVAPSTPIGRTISTGFASGFRV
jgi:tetratricopeptide (TPR) repeat protein